MGQLKQMVRSRLLFLSMTGLFCIALGINETFAQSDTLVLGNGGVLVGEIQKMDKNTLHMKMDYSHENFKIKWNEVSQLYSSRIYLIVLSNGSRIHDNINSESGIPNEINIGNGTTGRVVKLSEIVSIDPVDDVPLGRFNASLAIGYNLAKVSSFRQFSSRIGLRYKQDSWSTAGFLDIVTNSQDNTEDWRRTHGFMFVQYYLKSDWFLMATTDLLSNEAQKLDLRAAVGAGIGKFVLHNNRVQLSFSGGGVYNSETFSLEGVDENRSQELFLGGQLDMFNMGDLDIFTYLFIYPSISESGRFRSDFKFDVKYDLPLDFFINLGITLNYDNQAVEGASKADYILQTTLGWTFKSW